MKVIQYKGHNLAQGSAARSLYEQWRKTGRPEDQKKLDAHVKQVLANGRALLERYK